VAAPKALLAASGRVAGNWPDVSGTSGEFWHPLRHRGFASIRQGICRPNAHQLVAAIRANLHQNPEAAPDSP